MSAARLSVENLSWSPARSASPLLHSTSFTLEPGRVLGLVGSNGAGKTTLLRLLYRFHRPSSGRVLIDDQDIWALSARTVAQRIAAVLQESPSDFSLTVAEIVALGRPPHKRKDRDRDIVREALAQLDIEGLAERHLATLSGGERQRVMVARALAQEPQILILDEPTNHLDIRHQLEILELIRKLPLTVVTSLHDLNLAGQVCDDVLLLQSGRTIGMGAPAEVLSEVAVSQAFDVIAQRDMLSRAGSAHLTFHLPAE